MRQSSGDAVVWHEPGSVVKHGPEDVDASPCESDYGLLVLLSLRAFAVVEGSALGLCKRAEGGPVDGLLECLVAPDGQEPVAVLAGVPAPRGAPGGCGQSMGGG